jgi:hypothetical protein
MKARYSIEVGEYRWDAETLVRNISSEFRVVDGGYRVIVDVDGRDLYIVSTRRDTASFVLVENGSCYPRQRRRNFSRPPSKFQFKSPKTQY